MIDSLLGWKGDQAWCLGPFAEPNAVCLEKGKISTDYSRGFICLEAYGCSAEQ